MHRLFALLAVVALALFVAAPINAADDGTHTGKVVKVDGTKLTMTGKDGKEHTHVIPAGAKVIVDGKDAKLADLKEGQEITVIVDKKEITKVEAKK